MAGYKAPDFNQRSAASRAARETALEKLRTKAAPDPAVIAERQAARAAREAAAAERRAAAQRAIQEEKAARIRAAEEKAAAEQAEAERLAEEAAAKLAAAKPARTEAELKAARDARYAARKARKR